MYFKRYLPVCVKHTVNIQGSLLSSMGMSSGF